MDIMPVGYHDRPPYEVLAPQRQTLPLVLASPHSGTLYPGPFRDLSALDAQALRRSEDTFVDELFALAPDLGAPLVRATYPRAYLDLNREPYELDPEMFEDPLPDYVNTTSPRVAAGLGTIAKVVGTGTNIYRGKLTFAEAQTRIEALYHPYHAALAALVEATRLRFGYALLLDCHSMPAPLQGNPDLAAQIVLGDRHGLTCAPAVMETAEATLRGAGYRVSRNMPYAGGFTTSHYGRPAAGTHTLQIEVSRRLYMDESTRERFPAFDDLRDKLAGLILALGSLPAVLLQPHPSF
ncbi:N-formylglutamate amidohydrolase [Rhodospirillum rubrum]|uniref:N-formylglutamate amidohydrolase n=1 Tax=Rhodospirillum rubrum TaxID=1085 RepID=UPI001904C7F0|nr:N-formylglutamate amidohydrolase [Rhodospirillum rubrum]MBK1664817.1 N-formylglutamate amidohydrolase [Rhodospirillum rubrum]MBK1675522.1 N-formylglutamate amidohydrolase [Rhodospirillum rubrum]